jgi:hypothetical protein
LPRRLKRAFGGHDVRTVPEAGWASRRNGELLRLAQHEFDVFVTADQKLRHQQHLASFQIAVIVLAARSNTLLDLQPLMPRVLQLLADAPVGAATVVGEIIDGE